MSEAIRQAFGVVDYLLFLATLAISVGIGVYYGFIKKQKSNKDFLVGGKKMSPFPVACSLFASYMSAISILGVPAELFDYGAVLWEASIANVFFLPLVAVLFVKGFYDLNVTSAYEYLELRFDSRLVRLLASGTFILQICLYMGVATYAPSLALASVIDFPVWGSVVSIIVVATIYTAIGGLKAVIWTDVFQVFIMMAGMVAIIIQASIQVGGIDVAFKAAHDHGRFNLLNFDPDPFVRNSSLTVFFGAGFFILATYGCHQTQIQRYSSMPSSKSAVTAVLLNIPMGFVFGAIMWITAVTVFAVYVECDPKTVGHIEKRDQMLPLFVAQHLHFMPGIMGLFVASLLSGTLSTLSSGLNSLAAVTWEDFLKDAEYFRTFDAKEQLFVTKLLGFIYGGIIICISLMVGQIGGLMAVSLAFDGAVIGPLLGTFCLGFFIPFSNYKGAIVGILVGHAVSMWISFGAMASQIKHPVLPSYTNSCIFGNYTDTISITQSSVHTSIAELETLWPYKLYYVSFMLYPIIGCFITVSVGCIVSVVTGGNKVGNSSLLHPFFRKIRKSIEHQDVVYTAANKRNSKIEEQELDLKM